jgi:hypothetical protein
VNIMGKLDAELPANICLSLEADVPGGTKLNHVEVTVCAQAGVQSPGGRKFLGQDGAG